MTDQELVANSSSGGDGSADDGDPDGTHGVIETAVTV
jgi:hypothetical protein